VSVCKSDNRFSFRIADVQDVIRRSELKIQ
jgi:hypothetical protein